MAEEEITALKVAICNQFLVIKRLYTELEEEREASASGADEALSMILRLQKEKAEEKMEHCQYRKMAEAKMQHAEESLAMLEQVLFQKEFENSSLKYQVQTYTQKLLSIGVGNTDLNNIAIFGNRIFIKSSSSLERTSYRRGIARRQVSMPSIQWNKLLYEMEIFSGDGSIIPSLQSIRSEVGVYENHFEEKQKQQFSREAVVKECNSDSEQVQEVDGSVNKVQQTQNFKHTAGSKCLPLNKESHKSVTIDPQSYQETPDHESNDQSILVEPTTLATLVETDIQRLKHRIQQVEADIYVMKQEDMNKGKRELKLLQQLGTVPSHIRNLLSHKHSPHDVAMFDFLTEAMLSFSI